MFLGLLILWIIFNGKLTLEIFLFGVVLSAVLYLFACKFLNFSPSKDMMLVKEAGLIIWYIFNLLWEIILANIATLKFVFTSKYEKEPVLVEFTMDFKYELSRVLLANSITMTPGTITVSLKDNTYIVHCLDKEMAIGLNDSSFVHILDRMEEVRDRYEEKKEGK